MSNFPYPGLRPFKPDESDIFRGRDEFIIQLAEKLNTHHFIAVLGDSGCGKTSLVRTGLRSYLQRVRLGGRDFWRVAILRPGSQPFSNTVTALFESPPDVEKDALKTLREYYKGDRDNAIAKMTAILSGNLQTPEQELEQFIPDNHNLLIVVDQFEELFHHADKGRLQRQEVKNFIQWLLAIARAKSKIYIILTMRSEYLKACSESDSLMGAINDGFFHIPHLNKEQIRDTIEFPATVHEGEVKPELVERLLNDIENLGEDCRSDQLPLLQYVLVQMWLNADSKEKILTVEHYEKLGGNLAAALTQTADQIYNNSTAAEKKVIEILFRRLCQKEDIYTRHPTKIEEIANLAHVNLNFLYQVTDKFRQYQCDFLFARNRSIRSDFKADDEIDIRHESIIRQWKTLKQWADDEAEWAIFYRHWERKSSFWKNGKNVLWRDTDLDNANTWVAKFQRLYPNPDQIKLWTSRYSLKPKDDEGFKVAWDFLEKSQAAWIQEQKAVEEAKRRAIEQEIALKDKQKLLEFAQKQQELAQKQSRFWWKTAVVAGVATFFVAMGLGWGLWERNNAILAKQQAEETEQIRTENLFETYRRHAALIAKQGDYAQAQKTLQQSHELDTKIAETPRHARNFLSSFLEIMRAQPQPAEFRGAKAVLYAATFSPDKRQIAAVGEKGTVILFDKESKTIVHRFTLEGYDKDIKAVVFDPKNQWIATAGQDKQIVLWSLPTGEILNKWATEDEVTGLAVDPNGEFLFSAGQGTTITLWNTRGEKQTIPIAESLENISEGMQGESYKKSDEKKVIKKIALSPDNTILAVAVDHQVNLLQIKDWQKLPELKAHSEQVQDLAFSPDGKILATASDDSTVRLWNVATGENTMILKGHTDKVFSVAFTEDGRYVISGGADTTMRIWEINSGVTVRVFQGHTGFVTDLIVDGKQLYSSSTDSTIKQWSLDLPHQYTVRLETKPTAVAISSDGKYIAIGSEDGSVELHPISNGTRAILTPEKAHFRDVQRLAFSPDGAWLASASLDNTAKLWQVENDPKDNTLKLILKQTIVHESGVNGVAFSPNGKSLLTASYDGKMKVVDLENLNISEYLLYKQGDMNSVVWDKNGDFLLTTNDNQAYLWKNGEFSKPKITYPATQDTTFWAALSPDAQQTALVGRDFLVQIFPKQGESYVLQGHKDTVLRAEFSPDGQQLATVSGDNTVKFWDLLQRNELFTINLPTKGKDVIWDFDLQCVANQPTCWVAVPLTRERQVILYQLN